jgi:hypothetical protein
MRVTDYFFDEKVDSLQDFLIVVLPIGIIFPGFI